MKEFYDKRVEGFAPITVKNLAATANNDEACIC